MLFSVNHSFSKHNPNQCILTSLKLFQLHLLNAFVFCIHFTVVNEEDPNTAEDPLTYKIRARLMATVDCLTDDPAKECSGHGTCDTSLGRCTCVNQYTGDDCGDAGVFALVVDATTAIATATTAQKPSIPADGWVYYSISIGCNTTVKIDFTTASDAR